MKNIWVLGIFGSFSLISSLAISQTENKASTPPQGSYAAKDEGSDVDADEDKSTRPKKRATFSGGAKSDQTNINFEETLLEGKMKAPAGTFLQGRKEQQKNQLVNLRTQFRKELRRSRAGARALSD